MNSLDPSIYCPYHAGWCHTSEQRIRLHRATQRQTEQTREHAHPMQKDQRPGLELEKFLLQVDSATNCATMQTKFEQSMWNIHNKFKLVHSVSS